MLFMPSFILIRSRVGENFSTKFEKKVSKAVSGVLTLGFFENFSATLDPIGIKLGMHTLLVSNNIIHEN